MDHESLHYHAMVGNYLRVQFLVREGVHPDGKDADDRTPLMLAAGESHTEIVEFLISSGADIHCCDNMGLTVLHHASLLGSVDVVRCLVGCKGVVLDARDSHGRTPLMLAARNSRREVFQFLINSDVDIHCCDNSGWTVLHYASYLGSVEVVHCLVKKGVDLNIKNACSRTPLMLAVHKSHIEITELLVHLGADIHCCDKNGMTVLHYAIDGAVEMVHFLVNKGVALDIKDANGLTPLMLAAHMSYRKITELLVHSGADINCCDESGMTVLHHACLNAALEVIPCLATYKGVAFDAKDSKGHTPLMLVARIPSRELVELFINLGADIHCCDSHGRTVLHHALDASDNLRDQGDIVQLLLQKHVDVNARDFRGSTPLHRAVYLGRLEIAAHLLRAGVDCNLENNQGETPFNVLMWKSRHFETIKLCIEKGAYVKSTDFDKLLKDPLLKKVVLQDVKLCSQAIINKFDNKDLPSLYKGLTSAQRFPHIDVVKIGNRRGIVLDVEKAVSHEIKAKGFCNLIDIVPLVLSILCVKSSIEKS